MGRPTAITSLANAEVSGTKNWIIYAESGVGKTVLAGSAPKALFLTVEAAGTESAKAFGSTADEWVCDSWAELAEAYKWLHAEGTKEYEWACLDSISEMEELCWADHLKAAASANSSRSEFAAAIQDYGIVDNKVKRLIDSFNRLPINVLYTAQMMTIEMENAAGDEYVQRLPLLGRPKNGAPLSNKICGKATLVGLLTVKTKGEEEPFRRLTVSGGEGWVAKDRHDTFGSFLDKPDVAEMAAAVDERVESGGGPRAAKKPATKAVPQKGKTAPASAEGDSSEKGTD